jgi:arginine decarboxylase-like protein
MSNITKNDIKTFGKVLQLLGETLSAKPELLMSILDREAKTAAPQQTKEKSTNLPEAIKDTDLFSFSKNHNKNEIIDLLKELSVDELKQIISHYNLGYTKLKSKEKIADYIADQFKKRTTDVFLKHEK